MTNFLRSMWVVIRRLRKKSPWIMGTFGYPMNFTLAENEEECPWEPYHVEQGFEKADSTVTACATVTWGWPPAIYGTSDRARQGETRHAELRIVGFRRWRASRGGNAEDVREN